MSLWLYWHSPEARITWAPAKFCFKSWQCSLFPVALWSSKISSVQFTQEGSIRKDPKPKMLSTICECNDLLALFRSVLFEHLAIKLICEKCAPTLVPYFFPFCDFSFTSNSNSNKTPMKATA